MSEIDAAATRPETGAGDEGETGWGAHCDLWSRCAPHLPVALFALLLAVAFPVLLLDLGRYHWFMRDEWVFLKERNALSFSNLFDPFNVHPVAVPVVAYIGLWSVFGLDSYRPYQAGVIALHLSAVVLLRVIMRSAGVRPWLATLCAGAFIFFGPGAQNILWAFQIGFTGALVLGLAQLVLADHDGPFTRRDALGVGAGILSVMSTGVGVTMALVVGLAVLGRRGWRIGFLHSAPLAAVYGTWYLIERPETSTIFGNPTPGVLFDWVVSGITGTFMALGQHRVVALALAGILVVGVALDWSSLLRRRPVQFAGDHLADDGGASPAPEPVGLRADGVAGETRRATVSRLSIPMALLVGSVVFPAFTGMTRWYLGADGARSSRYLHLGLALTLPALAVGAEALARRWRGVTPVVAVLLLSAVPANLDAFEPVVFGEHYMDERRRIITQAVRMPFARDVPPDVRPVPDVYDGELTIGFLLDAYDAGKLPAYPYEISTETENEMRIRLGLAQRVATGAPLTCEVEAGPVEVDLDAGDVVTISAPVRVWTLDGDRVTSQPVVFNPAQGAELTAELDDLDLRVDAGPGADAFTLCAAD